MKAGLLAIGVVALFALIGVVGYYGGIVGNHVQANYNKRVVTDRIRQHINQPEFAQSQYEHFFNLCASVQTAEVSLEQQYSQLAAATTDADKTRININIGGLVATRADAVNQYNAEAAEYTRGRFLASNLPARLSVTYSKENLTTCAV